MNIGALFLVLLIYPTFYTCQYIYRYWYSKKHVSEDINVFKYVTQNIRMNLLHILGNTALLMLLFIILMIISAPPFPTSQGHDLMSLKVESPLAINEFDVELQEYLEYGTCGPHVAFDHFKHLLNAPTPCGSEEKCVISMAIWGSSSRYVSDRTITFIQEYQKIFKGWEIWIYINEELPSTFRKSLNESATIFFPHKKFHGSGTWNTMWRFLPLFESSVTRFIIRDVDSGPSIRDWGSVYEWTRSQKPFLRQVDYPTQDISVSSFPFMAGMVGIMPSGFTKEQIEQARARLEDKKFYESVKHQFRHFKHSGSLYGIDQVYLAMLLSEEVFNPDTAVSFDPHFCEKWSKRATIMHYPIPLTKCNYFIGSNSAYWGRAPKLANPKCVHPDHKNWIYG